MTPSVWIRPLPGGLGISADLEPRDYHFEYVPRERLAVEERIVEALAEEKARLREQLDETTRDAEALGTTLAELRAEIDAKRVFVGERWDIRWPDGGALECRSLRQARKDLHGGGRIVHVKVYRVKKERKS